MSKQYCTMSETDCSLTDSRGFWYLPETILGDILWVCPGCLKPRVLIWEKLLRRCEDCLREYPLPWEKLCPSCFKESSNEIYMGLQWARTISIPLDLV